MSTSLNAVASSSKRPTPPTTATSTSPSPPAKRPRPSSNRAESVADESEDEQEGDEPRDEAARAKLARKEARTIRNRESAQRSRNQRKAHLVYLEQRVSELEAENRALRAGGSPPPTRAKSADREASPAQSVISLANDLGIPPEIVSSSGGVNLANVAPPPADLEPELKPVIASPSPAPMTQPLAPLGNATLAGLQVENATLRERVGLLENLVKQVVALANLSGLPSSATPLVPGTQTVHTNPTSVDDQAPLDWDTLVNSTTRSNNLNATLSPSMYPVEPLASSQIDMNLTPSLPSVSAFPSNNSEMNLACHPAAGEDNFTFGTFGNELGPFGSDGKSDHRIGESTGNVVPFSFDLDNTVGQSSFGSPSETGAFDEARVEVGEDPVSWDEGMRTLLEDLEGRGVAAEAAEGEKQEVVYNQGIKKEYGGVDEWWMGKVGGSTALGLAM